jgi:hypothetical protein
MPHQSKLGVVSLCDRQFEGLSKSHTAQIGVGFPNGTGKHKSSRTEVDRAQSLQALRRAIKSIRCDLHSLSLDFGPTFRPDGALYDINGICTMFYDVLEAFQSWWELFHIYGFNFHSVPRGVLYRVLYARVLDVRRVILEGVSWIAYFKYFNASFYATVLGQEPPAYPSWIHVCRYGSSRFLFGGRFYSWQRMMERDFPERFRSFALSILMSKKGMPRPNEEMIYAAVLKSAKVLTTSSSNACRLQCLGGSQKDSEKESRPFRIGFTRDFIRRETTRTVNEIFGKSKIDFNDLVRPYLPSTSSNYNWTRGKCGTYAELMKLPAFAELWERRANHLELKHKVVKLSGYISDYYGQTGVFDQFVHSDLCEEVLAAEIGSRNFVESFRRFWW